MPKRKIDCCEEVSNEESIRKKKKIKIQSILFPCEYDTFVDVYTRHLYLNKCFHLFKPLFIEKKIAFMIEQVVYTSVHMNRRRYIEKFNHLFSQISGEYQNQILYLFLESWETLQLWVALDTWTVIQLVQDCFHISKEKEKEVKKRYTKDELIKECTEQMKLVRARALEGTGKAIYLMCPKKSCKSQNIEHTARQARSADEGMSMFCKCKDCGQKWREN